jgi:hypothetical protein
MVLYHPTLISEGGVTVFKGSLPNSNEEFSIQIRQSLEDWRAAGKRGVWLEIPASKIGMYLYIYVYI